MGNVEAIFAHGSGAALHGERIVSADMSRCCEIQSYRLAESRRRSLASGSRETTENVQPPRPVRLRQVQNS